MTARPKDVPAFPTEPNTQSGFYVHHGMSLRDWFAGQALVALAAEDGEDITINDMARDAYRFADAMIAEAVRNADLVFLAVGTPSADDGNAEVAHEAGGKKAAWRRRIASVKKAGSSERPLLPTEASATWVAPPTET